MKKVLSMLLTMAIVMSMVVCYSVYAEENINPYEVMYFNQADYKTMIGTETSDDGDVGVGGVANQYLVFKNVDFGANGVSDVKVKYAGADTSAIYIYAVDADGTTEYTCSADGSGIASLKDKEIFSAVNASTGSWTGQVTKSSNVSDGRLITGVKNIVVAFGGYGNYFTLQFTEKEAYDPERGIRFIDATYTTAGINGGPLKTDLEGNAVTEDYRGINNSNNTYAAYKNVELRGISKINIVSSQIYYSSLATFYILPAGVYDLKSFSVTEGKIDGLEEVTGIWNESNGTWDVAQKLSAKISDGKKYNGTYDVVISFADNYGGANFWYFDFDMIPYQAYEEIKFVDATYTTAGINGGPLLTDLNGNAVTEDYRGLQDVPNKYAAFKNVELNGVSKINVVGSVQWSAALSTLYILPAGNYDLTQLTVKEGKIEGIEETIGVWNQPNGSWDVAQLSSAEIENGDSYVGTYDIVVSFNDNYYGANFWYIYFDRSDYTAGISPSDGIFEGNILSGTYDGIMFEYGSAVSESASINLKNASGSIVSGTVNINGKFAFYVPNEGITVTTSGTYILEVEGTTPAKATLIEEDKIQKLANFVPSKFADASGVSWIDGVHFGGTSSPNPTIDYIIDFGNAGIYDFGISYATTEHGVAVKMLLDGEEVVSFNTPSTSDWSNVFESIAEKGKIISGIHKVTYSYIGSCDLYDMWFEKLDAAYSKVDKDGKYEITTVVDNSAKQGDWNVIIASYDSEGNIIEINNGTTTVNENIVENISEITASADVTRVSAFIWDMDEMTPFRERKDF